MNTLQKHIKDKQSNRHEQASDAPSLPVLWCYLCFTSPQPDTI